MKWKTKFLYHQRFPMFKLRFLISGKKKQKYFKIIISDSNNKYIDLIGVFYFNKLIISNTKKRFNFQKVIWIDFERLAFWMSVNLYMGPFMYKIISSLK